MTDVLPGLTALALSMMRPYGILLILPLFTARSLGSSLLRNGLIVAIALPVTPLFLSAPIITNSSPVTWIGVLCTELLIGVVMGFVAALPFWAMNMAGFLIDTLRGATMSTLFNPRYGRRILPFWCAVYPNINGTVPDFWRF